MTDANLFRKASPFPPPPHQDGSRGDVAEGGADGGLAGRARLEDHGAVPAGGAATAAGEATVVAALVVGAVGAHHGPGPGPGPGPVAGDGDGAVRPGVLPGAAAAALANLPMCK